MECVPQADAGRSQRHLYYKQTSGVLCRGHQPRRHFQTGAVRHDSTRPRENLLAHVVLHFTAGNTHCSYVQNVTTGIVYCMSRESHESF